MWLVDLNYNFDCDNKLSNANLASELVEKWKFFKPVTKEEIVIFMINSVVNKQISSLHIL